MVANKVCVHAFVVILFSILSSDWHASEHVARAATLSPGTIVVGESSDPAQTTIDTRLLAVDPITGTSTVISDDAVGTGPSLTGFEVFYLSEQNDGSLLAVARHDGLSSDESRLLRVDPTTGNRTLIADVMTPSGANAFNAARQVGSTIFVTTQTGLETVNPTTGVITPFAITGAAAANAFFGFLNVGTEIYAAADNANAIYKIDSLTGVSTLLSGISPSTQSGTDLALDSAGSLYAALFADIASPGSIYRVDPTTGDHVLVSGTPANGGPNVGTGPAISALTIGVSSTGAILAMNIGGSLLSIDPTTGDRTVLSQIDTAGFPTIGTAGLVVIANTPEAPTLVLAALGGLALLASRRRTRVTDEPYTVL